MELEYRTNGPGKYDDVATVARESAGAVAVLLIVIHGDRGSGFSVQTLEPDLLPVLPALLEETARQIRLDAQRASH
jgi:hypothetical protein